MSSLTLAEVLASGYGVERSFCCPVHGDNDPSASVNTIKMVWVCYACGAHGRVGGEVLAQDVDVEQARRHLLHKVEATPRPESWLNIYDSDHPYWRTRFTEETIQHFRLGHDYGTGSATYPLRDVGGAPLGVVRRPIDAAAAELDGKRKYVYPWGVDVSRLLFDYHRLDSGTLVLTEGATDAMAGWEARADVAWSAVYGSTLHRYQTTLIRRYDPTLVVCAFDLDDAGYQAYSSVAYALPEYRVARIRWDKRLGKDLSSLDLKTRREILAEGLAPVYSKT